MPAYTSISFSIPRPVQPDLIRQFYKELMSDGIAFKCVNSWCVKPEKSQEEIINWNQKQAELKTPPDKEGYMQTDSWQVYLDAYGFRECRLIQSDFTDEVCLRCIVPEGQVSVETIAVFERAALRIWNSLPVRLIETSGELDSGLGYELVSKGLQPSVMPFAIVDDLCSPLASSKYFKKEPLSRGTILRARIKDKTKVLFEGGSFDIAHQELIQICKAIDPQLLQPLKEEKGFPSQNPSLANSVSDIVETLIKLVQNNSVELSNTNLNRLAYIANSFGLEFRSPHLKGTWLDY